MAQSSTLTTLKELAEKQTDEAAAKLGAAIRQFEDQENKLAMLKKYREDYSLKMQAEMRAGRDMQHIRNFQVFLGKIDDALFGQQQLVNDAMKRVQAEKKHWQENERKRMSFSALEQRAEQAEQKKEAKRDQKLMDEFGARQSHYKQH